MNEAALTTLFEHLRELTVSHWKQLQMERVEMVGGRRHARLFYMRYSTGRGVLCYTRSRRCAHAQLHLLSRHAFRSHAKHFVYSQPLLSNSMGLILKLKSTQKQNSWQMCISLNCFKDQKACFSPKFEQTIIFLACVPAKGCLYLPLHLCDHKN